MTQHPEANRTRFLFLLFFLPGFLMALYRGYIRLSIEEKDAYVETVMDFEELRTLAREEGWSLDDTLQMVASKGASSVGISEDTLQSLEMNGRISVLGPSDVEKLAGDGGPLAGLPAQVLADAGALWVRANDQSLLERIRRHLEWKIPGKVQQPAEHFLLIHKSSPDFRQRVGLGFSPEYLNLARGKGLGIVLRVYNFPGLSAEAIRQILNELPDGSLISALIFAEEEVLGNRGAITSTITGLLLHPYRLGWVEMTDQAGMDQLLSGLGGRIQVVKVHSIGRKEMDETYTVSRATARWIRSVRDRRLKMLYIRCFFQDKKKFIGDLFKFNLDYLSGIVKGLEEAGFKIPRDDIARKDEARYSMPPVSWLSRLLMGVSLLTGFSMLLFLSRKRRLDRFVITSLGLLSIAAGVLLPKALFIALSGLVGAVAFSTMGCVWAIDRLEEQGETLGEGWGVFSEVPGFLGRLVVPSVLGGILIVGLHSEADDLLKFQQFRGIKLAFLLPLLWIGFWTIRRYGGAIFEFFSRPLTIRDLLIGFAVVGGLAVYLVRSGNVTFLKPSEVEDVGRTFLENLLVARPRNKEFLIGYPAMLFFLFFRMRGLNSILPVLALCIGMGQVSVLNTFCHFHSPLTMAFIRGFNGLWTGLLVGAAMIVCYWVFRIFASVFSKEKTGVLVGYFGFGNLGDEVLWRTFVQKAREQRPEYRWKILWGNDPFKGGTKEAEPLYRKSPLALLESLASARAVVVPGGGVLQASTSSRSLLYYLGLLVFGKITGSRFLLPGQGLGPWNSQKTSDSMTPLFRAIIRYLLDFCDYLSLRDRESEKCLIDLPTPMMQAPVATDLAFAADVPTLGSKVARSERILMGVILRGSVSASETISAKLQEWNQQHANVRIVPLSLQSPEDEKVWGFQEKVYALDVSRIGAADNRLAEMDVIVSMRLHGCILATLFGVPWIGLAYDPKVSGFAREANWEFIGTPEEFSLDWFENMFTRVTANSLSLKEKLAKIREEKRNVANKDIADCLSCLK